MWGLSWTKWHWYRVFSECLGFPLLLRFHQCSTLISIYWLLLSEGQMGQDWGNLKNKASSAVGGALDRNVLALFFVFKVLRGNTLAHFRQMSDSNFEPGHWIPLIEVFRYFLRPSMPLGQDCSPQIFNINYPLSPNHSTRYREELPNVTLGKLWIINTWSHIQKSINFTRSR